MKFVIALLILAMPGCTTLTITGDDLVFKSPRRAAIQHGDSTIVTGQVFVSDETIQALGAVVPDDEQ